MTSSSLKDKTAKGLLWGGLNNGLQQLLNLFFGIFLARLLMPADYGMVGMLTIFSLIASTLQESGFTAALANKQDVKQEDYNAVFWFSTLTGALLYVLLFFLSPCIAAFYHQPQLVALGRYTFLGFFIASMGIAPHAYLFKTLRVKQKALIQLASLTLSGIVGVILAFRGMAYWGIATQSLVYVSSNTLLYWFFSGWRPSGRINLRPLRSMLSFSSKILVTNLFATINNNMLTVILGRFYTEKEVGFFNQGNKWTSMGFSTVLGMVNGVAQPVLRNVADDAERQLRVFRKMLRFTAFTSFPALFGLAFVAPELITIAITDKWAESANMMQWLCVGSAFLPISNLYTNLIISKGRSDVFMWNTIALGIVQVVAALCFSPWGIYAMIWGYISINVLWLLVWHFYVSREIDLSLWHALTDVLPYAGIAAGCIGLAWVLLLPVHNEWLSLLLKVVMVAVFYVAVMKVSGSVTYKDAEAYLLHRRKEL